MSQSKIANRQSFVCQESFARWDWRRLEKEMFPAKEKALLWRSALSRVHRIRQSWRKLQK